MGDTFWRKKWMAPFPFQGYYGPKYSDIFSSSELIKFVDQLPSNHQRITTSYLIIINKKVNEGGRFLPCFVGSAMN